MEDDNPKNLFYKPIEDKPSKDNNKEQFEMSTISANETYAEDIKTTYKPRITLEPTKDEANEQKWKNVLIKIAIVVYFLIFLVILYEFVKG